MYAGETNTSPTRTKPKIYVINRFRGWLPRIITVMMRGDIHGGGPTEIFGFWESVSYGARI